MQEQRGSGLHTTELKQARIAVNLGKQSTEGVGLALVALALAAQAFLQPVKLSAEVALDVGGRDADHAVAPALQPGFSRRAIGDDGVGLVRIDQLEGEAMHEGDEIGNLAADGSLPLELAGEAAVASQRLP